MIYLRYLDALLFFRSRRLSCLSLSLSLNDLLYIHEDGSQTTCFWICWFVLVCQRLICFIWEEARWFGDHRINSEIIYIYIYILDYIMIYTMTGRKTFLWVRWTFSANFFRHEKLDDSTQSLRETQSSADQSTEHSLKCWINDSYCISWLYFSKSD